MIHRIGRLAVVAVLALTATIGLIAPATADTRSVSISVGDWNCRQNGQYSGSISKVLITAVPSSGGQPGWLSGRTRSGVNVIYNANGSRVEVQAVIFCKTAWYGAGYYRELVFGKWVDRNTSTSWSF